jgi:hypothetical protein
VALIRKRVDVRYDPFDISLIEIWYEGKFRRKAEKLCIPENTSEPTGIPVVTKKKPTGSRLLKVYEDKNQAREKQRNGALSFHDSKGDEN